MADVFKLKEKNFLKAVLKYSKMQQRQHLSLSPSSQRLEVKAQVAQAFLSKFQLTNEEMATLRGTRDAPITEVITVIMWTPKLN